MHEPASMYVCACSTAVIINDFSANGWEIGQPSFLITLAILDRMIQTQRVADMPPKPLKEPNKVSMLND